jgi:hypothetical protein
MSWAIGDRLLGAVLGGGVSAAGAVAATGLGYSLVAAVGAVGIPFGMVSGFLMARRVLQEGSVWRPAALTAVLAVGLFVLSLELPMLFLSMSTRSYESVAIFLTAPWIIAFAFVFGMPIAVPMAVVAAMLLRRLAPLWHERYRRLRHGHMA